MTYPRCTHAICDVAGTGDPNRTVSFGYDQGWLESIYGYGTLALHPNGMVHRVDHSNSRRDIYVADPYGMARPSNVQVVDSLSGAVIVDLGLHQYDPVGNLMTRGGERYHYDLAGRLVRYQAAGGGYQVYGFDGFGNLTSTYKSALGGTVTYVTSATTNRLASGTYDGAGNLLSLSPHSQTWDPLDTLMQRGQQEETYLYTASDERLYAGVANANRTIQKMAAETWTLRDRGGEVLTAYATNGGRATGAWSWQQDYVYRGNAVLASVRPGIVHHYTLDHLGTPRATWGPTGQLVVARSYWGFGEDMSASDTDPEKKRFTGHERDTRAAGTADDLDYMHARYYSPMWGRFLSVDPIGGTPENPQTWNRYSYVLGRPLNLVDPQGLTPSPLQYYYYGEGISVGSSAGLDPSSRFSFDSWAFRSMVSSAETPSSGLLNVNSARAFYHRLSDSSDSVLSIWFYESLLDWLPQTQGELGVEIVLSVVPGPIDNAAYAAAKGMKVTGYTRHGLNQAISRNGVGVAPIAILDAVRSPLIVKPGSRGTLKFMGEKATVVLNANGKVVSAWAKSSAWVRIF